MVCNINVVAEVSRDAAVQWCLQNEFELVELNSDSEDVSDDEGLLTNC